MKIESSVIGKIKSRLFARGGTPRPLIQPTREWGVSILVSVLLSLSLFSYAGYVFYVQYTDSDMPEVSAESIPRYRENDATSFIRLYDGKAEAFETLRSNRPPVAPPVEEVLAEEVSVEESVAGALRVE